MANTFNITEVEGILKSYFTGALSLDDDTIRVFDDRPKAKPDNYSDYAVIRVTGTLRDMRTHGECTITLALFAKDVGNMKNAIRLSVMQERVMAGIPADTGSVLLCDSPSVSADNADDYGYHWRMITFQALVKVR